jgi:tetrahydromethanopterin S-methyltransferase subunit G
MENIEDLRKLLAPDLCAIQARLDAIEKQIDGLERRVDSSQRATLTAIANFANYQAVVERLTRLESRLN